jgi:hypothetical protein
MTPEDVAYMEESLRRSREAYEEWLAAQEKRQ